MQPQMDFQAQLKKPLLKATEWTVMQGEIECNMATPIGYGNIRDRVCFIVKHLTSHRIFSFYLDYNIGRA